MRVIPLAPFAPDINAVESQFADVARNVYPTPTGYGPVQSPVPVFAALPGQCVGYFTVRTTTGQFITYAGTQTKLYRLSSDGQTWTDVSKTGSTYLVPVGDYWGFAQFGNKLVAVHVNSPPQVIDVDSGTQFADLAGSPPVARGVTVVGDFLVLYRLANAPQRIQWSDLNNITFWTPGLNLSDYNDFPDGGDVMGVEGGEYGVILQQNSLRRMVFAPGSPEIFQFSRFEENLGLNAAHASVKFGSKIFYLSKDGFYQLEGGRSVPIGANRVNKWFYDRLDLNNLGLTLAVADKQRTRVFWFFKSAISGSSLLLDTALVFDWSLDKWSYIEISAEYVATSSLPAQSLDSLTTTPINSVMSSLDSEAFSGSGAVLSAFNSAHRGCFFTGSTLEAVVQTGDAFLSRPALTRLVWVRPDTDADSYFVSVAGKFALSETASFGAEAPPEDTRFCAIDNVARYHAARVRIPAGAAWSFASGIEPLGVPAGFR